MVSEKHAKFYDAASELLCTLEDWTHLPRNTGVVRKSSKKSEGSLDLGDLDPRTENNWYSRENRSEEKSRQWSTECC